MTAVPTATYVPIADELTTIAVGELGSLRMTAMRRCATTIAVSRRGAAADPGRTTTHTRRQHQQCQHQQCQHSRCDDAANDDGRQRALHLPTALIVREPQPREPELFSQGAVLLWR